MAIPRSLQQHIRERAGRLCEYCHLPDTSTTLPFQIDHISAEKHAGLTILANLAYCCLHGNAIKGPNIARVDQETQEVVRLFHPRQDRWEEQRFDRRSSLRAYSHHERGTPAAEALRLGQRARPPPARLENCIGLGYRGRLDSHTLGCHDGAALRRDQRLCPRRRPC
jgi:HNH endonuclease